MQRMFGLHELPPIDEQQLPAEVAVVLQRMRQHIEQQARQIQGQNEAIQGKN